jgi:RHS repeat-associated protein
MPFGEELGSGVGGRTPGMGFSVSDGLRQKFTRKERDTETGQDYFGKRYYGSIQGRFTGADPYDINFERQTTVNPEEAEDRFRNYIKQAQHWNRYAYALNNPLRYVDPDGQLEYNAELLGKKIKIKISNNIEKNEQEAIKANLNAAIAKINEGADKLTADEKQAINSMNGIEVRNDINGSFFNPANKVINMKQRLAEHPTLDFLVAAIIHESFHAHQFRREMSFDGEENKLNREKEASAFAVDVGKKIGLSGQVIESYQRDAKEGHRAPSGAIYVKPPKKKNTP